MYRAFLEEGKLKYQLITSLSNFNRFLRFFVSENLSDAAVEECDVKYEKVGCFSDNPKNRALPKLILSDRDKINWQPGEWEKYLKR